MKHTPFGAALLITALLLTGCAGTEPSSTEGQVHTVQTVDGTPPTAEDGITLLTQYPVYDPSCTYISYIIVNNSDAPVEYGTEWAIEKKIGSSWRRLEFAENFAFTQPLITLGPGGTYTATCTLEFFKSGIEPGDYRVVKEISDQWYGAEFQIGASPITAEAPHGYLPLEQLPEDYSVEAAITDGVVVLNNGVLENADRVTEFFKYANDRNWKGQLRVAHFTFEGDMILSDLIRTRADRIDFRYDTTRDSWGGDEITQRYFSYFTTDGMNIYLSNHSTHGKYAEDHPIFAEGTKDVLADAIHMVSSYYDSVWSSDIPPIAVYSPDGEVRATTSGRGDTDLSFSTSGWGTMWGLKKENLVDGMKILDIAWQDNEICMIMASHPDGGYYYEFIRVDRESMKNIETVSYTYSQHEYLNYDGQLIIPE